MAEHKETIYINYFDQIDRLRANAIMALCTQLIGQYTPDKLYFTFSSPGGEVSAGITLYNFLKAIPPKIIMHNIGAVDSIGTVVFLAGDERYASPNTTFHFHGVKVGMQKDDQRTLSAIEEMRSQVAADEEKIAGIIASQTKITVEEMKKLFSQGEAKNPTFAFEKGFIHETKEAKIPKGETLININIALNIQR